MTRCNAVWSETTRPAVPCRVIEAEGIAHCPISRAACSMSSSFSMSEAHASSLIS